MIAYKYFSDEESAGLSPDLMTRLDMARELFGSPLSITSGLRTPDQNESVGGVSDSAHIKGMAVDLRCADQDAQKKMVWALGLAGLQRIGVYDRHIHVDVDTTKPTPAYWTGLSH